VSPDLRKWRRAVTGPFVDPEDETSDAASGRPPVSMASGTWLEVDLSVVAANTAALRAAVAPAAVCAVVSADAYGHGAIEVARTVLKVGAAALAVERVEEALVLREAGISDPVLLLSEPTEHGFGIAATGRMATTAWSSGAPALAAAAANEFGRLEIHVKVDSAGNGDGASLDEVVARVRAIRAEPNLLFGGLWTDLEAGRPDHDEVTRRRSVYDEVAGQVATTGSDPWLRYAAGASLALARPETRYNLVRCGTALYGYGPAPLRPAMALKATVVAVQPSTDGAVAVVSAGFADGVPSGLATSGGAVLIGGRRCPVVDEVTLGTLRAACHHHVAPGDEVVVLGQQGDERITAAEWADHLDVPVAEVLCALGPRLPRTTLHAPHSLSASPPTPDD
jgi:alanine racemase